MASALLAEQAKARCAVTRGRARVILIRHSQGTNRGFKREEEKEGDGRVVGPGVRGLGGGW